MGNSLGVGSSLKVEQAISKFDLDKSEEPVESKMAPFNEKDTQSLSPNTSLAGPKIKSNLKI